MVKIVIDEGLPSCFKVPKGFVPAAAKELRVRHPAHVRHKAWTMYYSGEHTLKQIAATLMISFYTLKEWYVHEHWVRRRKQLTEELEEGFRSHILQQAAAAGPGVVERHLKISKKIEEKLDTTLGSVLEKFDSFRDAEAAAKAMKAVSDVDARVIGLDEGKKVNVAVSVKRIDPYLEPLPDAVDAEFEEVPDTPAQLPEAQPSAEE